MPRIHLTLSEELYRQIREEADKNHTTVNGLLYTLLDETYSKSFCYDCSFAMESLIMESAKMQDEFTLADLPTFKNVERDLAEIDSKESITSIRSKLGKMYKAAVKKGDIEGVERATVEKNGKVKYKFRARAIVYKKRRKG